MVEWLTRTLLIAAGAVTSWFMARDAPNFSVIQGVVAMLLIAFTVAVLAFWPVGWVAWLKRSGSSRH